MQECIYFQLISASLEQPEHQNYFSEIIVRRIEMAELLEQSVISEMKTVWITRRYL